MDKGGQTKTPRWVIFLILSSGQTINVFIQPKSYELAIQWS